MSMTLCALLLTMAWPGTASDSFAYRLLLEIGDADSILTSKEMLNVATRILSNVSDATVRSKLLLRRGQALYAEGRYTEAARDLNEANKLNPLDPEIRWSLGRTLGQSGKLQEAKETLEALLRNFPGYAKAYAPYAAARARMGDETGALQVLTQAIELESKDAFAYYSRASFLASRREYEHALKDLDAAIALDPECGGAVDEAFSMKAYLLYKVGRYEQSIAYGRSSLTLNEDNKLAHLALCASYGDSGRLHISAHIGLKMYRKWPEDPQVVGSALLQLVFAGELEQASEIEGRMPRAIKKNGSVCRALGYFYQARKQYQQARQLFKASVVLDEADEHAMDSLSLFLSACPEKECRDGIEAKRISITLCEKTKWKNPWHIAVLASAYAELGDFKSARYWLF